MHTYQEFFLLLMLPVILFTGCTEEEQIIDRSYLRSDSYRKFKQQSLNERSNRSDERTAVKQVLKKLLGHPQTPELDLPFLLDSLSVNNYLQSPVKFDLKQSVINGPAHLDYTYYSIGRIQRGAIDLLFFLAEKESGYKNIEVAVASFKDRTLVDVQTIARFIKTISRRVSSTVQVDRSLRFTSRISRERFYPVRQSNSTTYEYRLPVVR